MKRNVIISQRLVPVNAASVKPDDEQCLLCKKIYICLRTLTTVLHISVFNNFSFSSATKKMQEKIQTRVHFPKSNTSVPASASQFKARQRRAGATSFIHLRLKHLQCAASSVCIGALHILVPRRRFWSLNLPDFGYLWQYMTQCT